MRMRQLLLPLLALLPMLLLTGPASGQYPPSTGGLELDKSNVRAGETLRVSGGGCRPNATVTIELREAGTTLGSTQADANGRFSTTVTIPGDASAGLASIFARCANPADGQRELTSNVNVLGVQLTRGDTLARTGAATLVPTGIAGAALIGVGFLAVLASRRKRAVG